MNSKDETKKQAQRALFHRLDSVASGTECTGLTPTPPLGEEEADSYTEIYDIPLEEDLLERR